MLLFFSLSPEIVPHLFYSGNRFMYWALCCCCYHGFMQISYVLSGHISWPVRWRLGPYQWRLSESLKASKVRPYQQHYAYGQLVLLFRNFRVCCASNAGARLGGGGEWELCTMHFSEPLSSSSAVGLNFHLYAPHRTNKCDRLWAHLFALAAASQSETISAFYCQTLSIWIQAEQSKLNRIQIDSDYKKRLTLHIWFTMYAALFW